MRATNVTRNRLVANQVSVADTFLRSVIGLIGRKRLPEGHGLWIPHCGSVHTFWMRFPIDVVFLNNERTVVHLVENMAPFRVSRHLGQARSILELPVKAIQSSRTELGDRLEFTAD